MRIVSLLPSATEILFTIGAGPDVVGITHECDYPQEAQGLPQLTSSALPHAGSSAEIDRHVRRSLHAGSSLYHLDADLLERLAPDLIVTQELCSVCAVSYDIVDRAAKRLRSDPRVVSLEPSSLDDVLGTIRFLGELTGHAPNADRVVEQLQGRINRLSAVQHASRPRVLVLEWTDPPMSAGHWTPSLVELAGGEPVLGNPGSNSRTLTWEEIAESDPDDVVVGPCGYGMERTHAAIRELDESVAIWRSLRAVRSRRVHAIDGNQYMNRPGPRLVDTAEIIAESLHTTAAR
jgi:iron complex transport system substrate-binding protein